MAAAAQSMDLQATINKYFPYLLEIRKRIFFIVCIFAIAAFVGFLYYERVITFILTFLKLPDVNIVFTSPFQFINLAMSSSITIGLIATFPFIISQVLSFLKPALKKKEYHLVTSLLPLSIILFIGGFAFGIVMMRYVVTLFYEKSLELAIGTLLDITMLLSKIIVTSSLMGLAFQFPVVLTILMHLKIVKYKTIAKQRPFAYVTALLFAAFLPPTDILSLALLTLPLVFLFEITLVLNKLFLRSHLL